MKQVDAGYAPGNTQDALQYQKQFQDRKQAWKAGVPDTTFFPHSAICRLRIFQSDGEYIGTGFYIGNDRILTCGHNLENATDVTVIPGKNDSAEPFGAFSARPADWVIHPKYQSGGNGDFDLAVIKTTIPAPNGGAFTNLEELLECQESPIIVCGYAADTVSENKQHLDGDAIRMLSDSGETFLYNLQTEPGNSGSPVYYVTERDDEERQQCVIETRLIGVHIASVTGSNIFNRGCRLTADKIAWINSIGKAASFAAAVQAQSHGRKYPPAYSHAAGARSSAAMQAAASSTSGVGDADDTTPNLTCIQGLKDQGRAITFVQRYLRTLTATEAANISNAGLSIVSCHEIGNPTKASYFTRAQGKMDGRTAFGQAQNAGQPAGTPIYFAVDYDAATRERPNIEDYFQGVQEGCAQYIADMEANGAPAVVYDIGVYGSACVLDWCQQQGIATYFWQAFAPGWCNNRQVWENANLHTTGLDTPVRCGLRLDHLEGWGNEGGWTTTSAAREQSLSVSLPAAPRNKRYAQGEAIDSSPRQIGDTAVTTIAGGTGNVTWELDQFAGVKMAAQTAVAPLQSGETIQLANWPYCDYPDGARAAAWFTVDWRYSGQAIGNVRISPIGMQQGPQPLTVEARIEDANAKEPNTVALLVRFTYRFSTAEGQGVVANTDLTLYSDGSIDQKSNWTARAAA
jgi:V8-like Glu-specific endopeptidase